MPPRDRQSNCSSGVRVDFYWHAGTSADEEEHIKAAVDALWEAIRRPGERGWHPHAIAMARAEFRDRLRVATRGELIPVDEVKELGNGHPVLFEIRWQTIDVVELGPPRVFKRILVRLIHAEPAPLGLAFVGLHAHEKFVINDGNDEVANQRATKDEQDAQIAKAKAIYGAGIGDVWGLERRER